jgi:type I restriction enzyme, S subunit
MMSWTEKELGAILTLNYGGSLPEKKRIAGEVPVYGSNGIVGTHNQPLVNSSGLIVGRKGSAGNIHYSRRPFFPIDTTFFIAPEDSKLDLEFLYYLLLHIDLKRILGDVGVPGLNREMAYRETASFPEQNDEQQKIAAVLGLVRRALEQQERLIVLTAQLKKALLNQLFTQGLRGESRKQTEIGMVPQSWEVMKIQDLVDQGIIAKPMDGNHGNIHPKSADFVKEGIPFVMASDLADGTIDFNACAYLRKEQADRLQKGFAYEGDVLISHKATIGVTAIVPKIEHYVMLTPQVTYYRVLDKRRLNNIYLKAYLDSALFQEKFDTVARDGSTRSYIGITKQRELHIALPSLDEQLEIANCFALVEHKCTLAKRKAGLLGALFRTLLHQLMTAQIRVKNLDLSEFAKKAAA